MDTWQLYLIRTGLDHDSYKFWLTNLAGKSGWQIWLACCKKQFDKITKGQYKELISLPAFGE
jgi:hypothetical protein